MHHHIIDKFPSQNSTSTGWKESRRVQGYEQLNCYHSYSHTPNPLVTVTHMTDDEEKPKLIIDRPRLGSMRM